MRIDSARRHAMIAAGNPMRDVQVFDNPSPEQFRADIATGERPALLRGVARNWPLVLAAAKGADQCMRLLAERATDAPIDIMRIEPTEEGRFHYTADGRALNFVRGRTDLRTFLAALTEQGANEHPFALVAQGLIADPILPGFRSSHPMPLVPQEATPRFWIGNAAKVATHNDPADNVAVVVAGRRRFTLFPPDQIANLYLGPLHLTPAGTPVSMVHVTAPDLGRYPHFAAALEAAEVAELGPGDALFIPYAWYHHVEATASFNMLVNYWWNPAEHDFGSPWDAMLHGILAIRSLPPGQRAAWKAMFDHYVFLTDGDPAAHIGEDMRGALGPMTEERARQIRRSLIEALQQKGDQSSR